jgi:type II secretory pathway component GspD/PulD (secretin)
MIESKIIEISKTDSHRLGFSYGNQNGFCLLAEDNALRPIDDLILKIETLISAGKAKIVAQPKIATTPNNEANINIGHRIPYALPVESKTNTTWTVNYIDAGIKLKILPQIIDGKTILASIQSEISNISEWKTTQAGDFPVISGRNAQTVVKIESGNTIVIGGLTSNQERKNVIKFPILGYLPIIGMFFQSEVMEKRETEIVFLIKPYVI